MGTIDPTSLSLIRCTRFIMQMYSKAPPSQAAVLFPAHLPLPRPYPVLQTQLQHHGLRVSLFSLLTLGLLLQAGFLCIRASCSPCGVSQVMHIPLCPRGGAPRRPGPGLPVSARGQCSVPSDVNKCSLTPRTATWVRGRLFLPWQQVLSYSLLAALQGSSITCGRWLQRC